MRIVLVKDSLEKSVVLDESDPLFKGFSEEAIKMCLDSDLWKLIIDEHAGD